MIRIQDFFKDVKKLKGLSSEEIEKLKDPKNIEYLIENYLMEDGDVLNIKVIQNDFGKETQYIVMEPGGKWFKQITLDRKNKGPFTQKELEYINRRNQIAFIKHVMRGNSPESYPICDVFTGKPFDKNKVNKEFTRSEIEKIATESYVDDNTYTLNNN